MRLAHRGELGATHTILTTDGSQLGRTMAGGITAGGMMAGKTMAGRMVAGKATAGKATAGGTISGNNRRRRLGHGADSFREPVAGGYFSVFAWSSASPCLVLAR
jgi:hypothetical protein